ncbi:hypothetical protein AB3329_01780 [Streptococcus sp. H31]|uniref:hypothetical protein n=1 Tax=Streptococcus huangxiaojuni TaxID=3237239 RepID=UPI0034A5B258
MINIMWNVVLWGVLLLFFAGIVLVVMKMWNEDIPREYFWFGVFLIVFSLVFLFFNSIFSSFFSFMEHFEEVIRG